VSRLRYSSIPIRKTGWWLSPKIDLLLEKPGYGKIDPISEKLLETLRENNGFLALNDKTSPEIIQALLGISKKNFKKAVGNLYKKKLIEFKSDGIKLL